MRDQIDLSAGHEEALYLFKKLSQRLPGEPWAAQPILSLVGPSGYGKSQFIQHLYFHYCTTPALPHISLDFGVRDAPHDLLNILGALQKSLSRQRGEQGRLLAFPRFDIIYARLKRSEGQDDAEGDETTELLSDLIGLFGNIHFLIGLILFILKLIVSYVPPLRALLQWIVESAYQRAGKQPQWRWYQDQVKKFPEIKINLPDNASVSEIRRRLNEMCSMGEPERKFLIEQILPKALLADLRYGIYNDEIPVLKDGPQYIVVFLDSFEALQRQSESTASQLLEVLTLNEYRKRGESDPLLLVVASEDRLPDMSREQLNRHFPPEATLSNGTVQTRGDALYEQWVQQLPPLDKRRTLQLEKIYLPLPLSTLSMAAIRNYLLRLDQRDETYNFRNEALIEDIQRATQGYPIFLERVAAALQASAQSSETITRDMESLFASEEGEQIVDRLLTLHCKKVEERLFMLSAIPRVFSPDILRLVLRQTQAEPFDDTFLNAEWKRYRTLPFLQASEDKRYITFIPGIRALFLRKLQIMTAESDKDYLSMHQQLYDYFTHRIDQRVHKRQRKEKRDELDLSYHSLALGLYQPVIQRAIEAQREDLGHWEDLLSVIIQAPAQKLPYDQITLEADDYLQRAQQQKNVSDSVHAIVLCTWLLASPGSDRKQVSRLWYKLGTAYQCLQQSNPDVRQDSATNCYQQASRLLDSPTPITRPLALAGSAPNRTVSVSRQRVRQLVSETYHSVLVNRRLQLVLLIIVVGAILTPLLTLHLLARTTVPSPTGSIYDLPLNRLLPDARNSWIGVTVESDGEFVGLSDGSIPFDYRRPDGPQKVNATNLFRKGDMIGALNTLQQIRQIDVNDAEALIAQQNIGLYHAKKACIVFVVITRIVEDDSTDGVNGGRDDLQGAYIAQRDYNSTHQQNPLCLYIANLGVNTGYELTVVNQIVQAAAASHGAIKGLIGWPGLTDSSTSEMAIQALERTHLPLVSMESYDSEQFSPNIFHLAPTRQDQGVRAATYAESTLGAKRAVIITDPDDPYGRALVDGFSQRFEGNGHQIVDVETYKTGQTSDQQLVDIINKSRSSGTDCIYFTGGIQEGSTLLEALHGAPAALHFLGSEQLYPLLRLSANDRPDLKRLVFTSSAYPAPIANAMKDLYQSAYDLQGHVLGYGYSIPDSESILSYDAMNTLFRAYTEILGSANLSEALKTVQVAGSSRADIEFTIFNQLTDQRVYVLFFDASDQQNYLFQ